MSLPRLLARVALLLLLCLPALGRAQSQTVLLASSDPRAPQLFEALDLELRGYGVLLVARPAPDGITAEAHEASARRLLTLLAARATIWVEDSEPVRVRVVAADREEVLEAPLPEPLAQLEPRIFAAVAGSVVLKGLQSPPTLPAAPQDHPVQQPAPVPASLDWRPTSPRDKARRTRFFLRAGLALGWARLHSGLAADRSPTSEQVGQAAMSDDPAQLLEAQGYDCQLGDTQPLTASDCKVAVSAPGLVFVPGVELVAGLRVAPQLALGLTARIALRHGEGTLARALLGAQAEWQLAAPEVGFWYSLTGGFGFGQIQARPASGGGARPYVRSGLYDVRAGALVGYRFTRGFGVYAAPVLHVLFPDQLWVIEPSLGLEARL